MAYNGFRKATGSGGGFLHNVSGKITAILFDSKVYPANGSKKEYTTLTAEVRLQQDGKDAENKQFLKAGFLYPGQSVSSDRTALVNPEGRSIVTEDSEFGKFVMSMLTAEPNVEADLDPKGLTFQGLVGYRVTFAKVLDPVSQEAIGRKRLGAKAKSATIEEIMAAGKRKDKADASKSYNVDYLAVSAVLGKEAGAGTKATKASAPAAATSTIDAGEVVLAMLAGAPGSTLELGKLNSALIKHASATKMSREDREATARAIKDVDFLAGIEGVVVDEAAKTIAIA